MREGLSCPLLSLPNEEYLSCYVCSTQRKAGSTVTVVNLPRPALTLTCERIKLYNFDS